MAIDPEGQGNFKLYVFPLGQKKATFLVHEGHLHINGIVSWEVNGVTQPTLANGQKDLFSEVADLATENGARVHVSYISRSAENEFILPYKLKPMYTELVEAIDRGYIVNHGLNPATALLARMVVAYVSSKLSNVTDIRDAMASAIKEGFLTQEESNLFVEYVKNPAPEFLVAQFSIRKQ